jgi:hypothetical protein
VNGHRCVQGNVFVVVAVVVIAVVLIVIFFRLMVVFLSTLVNAATLN